MLQAVVDMTRGHVFALFAEKWRIVDGEEHRHSGLIDGNAWQRVGIERIAHGVANFKAFQAHNGANVAANHLVGVHLCHALKGAQFLNFLLHHLTIALAECHLHTIGELATAHATHGNTSHIRIIVERSDEHLRLAFHHFRTGNVFDNGIEHGVNIVGGLVPVQTHPSLLGRAKHGGEIELVFRGIKVAHQFKHCLLHLVGAAVWLVHLINHHDRF